MARRYDERSIQEIMRSNGLTRPEAITLLAREADAVAEARQRRLAADPFERMMAREFAVAPEVAAESDALDALRDRRLAAFGGDAEAYNRWQWAQARNREFERRIQERMRSDSLSRREAITRAIISMRSSLTMGLIERERFEQFQEYANQNASSAPTFDDPADSVPAGPVRIVTIPAGAPPASGMPPPPPRDPRRRGRITASSGSLEQQIRHVMTTSGLTRQQAINLIARDRHRAASVPAVSIPAGAPPVAPPTLPGSFTPVPPFPLPVPPGAGVEPVPSAPAAPADVVIVPAGGHGPRFPVTGFMRETDADIIRRAQEALYRANMASGMPVEEARRRSDAITTVEVAREALGMRPAPSMPILPGAVDDPDIVQRGTRSISISGVDSDLISDLGLEPPDDLYLDDPSVPTVSDVFNNLDEDAIADSLAPVVDAPDVVDAVFSSPHPPPIASSSRGSLRDHLKTRAYINALRRRLDSGGSLRPGEIHPDELIAIEDHPGFMHAIAGDSDGSAQPPSTLRRYLKSRAYINALRRALASGRALMPGEIHPDQLIAYEDHPGFRSAISDMSEADFIDLTEAADSPPHRFLDRYPSPEAEEVSRHGQDTEYVCHNVNGEHDLLLLVHEKLRGGNSVRIVFMRRGVGITLLMNAERIRRWRYHLQALIDRINRTETNHYAHWLGDLIGLDASQQDEEIVEVHRITIASLISSSEQIRLIVRPDRSAGVGGCHQNSKPHRVPARNLPEGWQEVIMMNPGGKGKNDCGINCLREVNKNLPSAQEIRKLCKIPKGTMLNLEQINSVAQHYAMPTVKVFTPEDKPEDAGVAIDEGSIPLFLFNQHYMLIMADQKYIKCDKCMLTYINDPLKAAHVCRKKDIHWCQKRYERARENNPNKPEAWGFFDFETRLDLSRPRLFIVDPLNGERNPGHDRVVCPQVPTLCCFYWVDFDGTETRKVFLGTNCAEQFLDYLVELQNNDKVLNIFAHNGARFDSLLLLGEIKNHKRFDSWCVIEDATIKGTRLLKFQFGKHLIRDTFSFLPSSLERLCSEKQFNVAKGKTTEVVIDGLPWRTKDVCLMLPGLTPQKFVDFLETPAGAQYKRVYIDYCMRDCESLAEVWQKFYRVFNDLVFPITRAEIDPLRTVPTLPAAGMRLFQHVNSVIDRKTSKRKETYWCCEEVGWNVPKKVEDRKPEDHERYASQLFVFNLLNESILGGISDVPLPGHHYFDPEAPDYDEDSIIGLDVVSLYPWTMLTQLFPEGKPLEIVDPEMLLDMVLNKDYLAICRVRNVHMRPLPISHYPVPTKTGRDWHGTVIEETCMTSIDIKRILSGGSWVDASGVLQHPSLEFVSGLVWTETGNPFKAVLKDIIDEKKRQDVLAEQKKPEANSALRQACKMLANSLFGKMCERSKNYQWQQYQNLLLYSASMPVDDEDFFEDLHFCNGSLFVRRSCKEKERIAPIQFGVFILAYSRDLMQRYFDLVGRENVIATETDSIYLRRSCCAKLFASQDPTMRIGKEVGNLALEKENIIDGYWLEKKCYAYKIKGKENAPEMRFKGVPSNQLYFESYQFLCNIGLVSFPFVHPGEEEPRPIKDKKGFKDSPALIQWTRNLFATARTGVEMRRLFKQAKASHVYYDFNYSVIGNNPPLRYVQQHNMAIQHSDEEQQEEIRAAKRRRTEGERQGAQLRMTEVNYPEIQQRLQDQFAELPPVVHPVPPESPEPIDD